MALQAQKSGLKGAVRFVRAHPLVAALPVLCLAVSVALCTWGILFAAGQTQQSRRDVALVHADNKAARISDAVMAAGAVAAAVSELVLDQPVWPLPAASFGGAVDRLVASLQPAALSSVLLAPSGIVQRTGPGSAGAPALGTDLLGDPRFRAAALAAVASRGMVLEPSTPVRRGGCRPHVAGLATWQSVLAPVYGEFRGRLPLRKHGQ